MIRTPGHTAVTPPPGSLHSRSTRLRALALSYQLHYLARQARDLVELAGGHQLLVDEPASADGDDRLERKVIAERGDGNAASRDELHHRERCGDGLERL